MHCIFAVLYLRGVDSIMSNRLVVMSADDYPSYGVYQPPGNLFPTPNLNSGITVTKNRVSNHGTFNALYCSPTLNTQEIVLSITSDLSPLPPYVLCPPKPSHEQAKACHSHLTELVNQSIPVKIYSMDEVLQGNKCTMSQVISLVQNGIIMPAGLYVHDTPNTQHPLFYMTTDRRIKVSEILMSNQVFKAMHENHWHILAWSQGHLHLFREDSNPNYWTKITKYGAEKENAIKIIDFLVSFNLINHYFKVTPEGENVQLSGGVKNTISYVYTIFKNRERVKYDSRFITKILPDKFISNWISESSRIELSISNDVINSITTLKISNMLMEEISDRLQATH